jgi:hypothetical protein
MALKQKYEKKVWLNEDNHPRPVRFLLYNRDGELTDDIFREQDEWEEDGSNANNTQDEENEIMPDVTD